MKKYLLIFLFGILTFTNHAQEVNWEIDLEKGDVFETSGKDQFSRIIGRHNEFFVGIGFNMFYTKATIYVFDQNMKMIRKGLISIDEKVLNHSELRNIYTEDGKVKLWRYEYDKKSKERKIVNYEFDPYYINFENPKTLVKWSGDAKIPNGYKGYLWVKSSPDSSHKVFVTLGKNNDIPSIEVKRLTKSETGDNLNEYSYSLSPNIYSSEYRISDIVVSNEGKIYLLRSKSIVNYPQMDDAMVIDMNLFEYDVLILSGENVVHIPIEFTGPANENASIDISSEGNVTGFFTYQNPGENEVFADMLIIDSEMDEIVSKNHYQISTNSLIQYLSENDSFKVTRMVKNMMLVPEYQLIVQEVIHHEDNSMSVFYAQKYVDYNIEYKVETSKKYDGGRLVKENKYEKEQTKMFNLGSFFVLRVDHLGNELSFEVVPHQSRFRSNILNAGCYVSELSNGDIFFVFNDENRFNGLNEDKFNTEHTYSENYITGYIIDEKGTSERLVMKDKGKVFMIFPINYSLGNDSFLFYEMLYKEGSINKLSISNKNSK